ncbi:SdrD B-like domain-containing protein [Curtobacterium sp. 'Ferrero']|uniref:SdrD B-like domain-containing protein n=1 Tax=Curtobacterium sp. 'Ferrero' TaxID=2033654 RepID=UPI0011416699|nr:SdrD B-like domain-containing protein [Curtobacterium sp. 'Ferrero']
MKHQDAPSPRRRRTVAASTVTTVALALVTALTGPASAGAAELPSTADDAASTTATAPAAAPATAPAPAPVTAPAIAPATAPATAPASPVPPPPTSADPHARDDAAVAATLGLAVEVAKDGNGPFTTTDGPGGDTGDTNGIVRTLDTVTYRITVSSNGGTSTDERFTVTAPAGTAWSALPSSCTGPGSGIVGQVLTCNLGSVTEGSTVATPVALTVSADLRAGDTVAVQAEVTADDSETVRATSPSTTVSAVARYNLSKDLVGSQLKADVLGPDGRTRGFQLVYPISVDWLPVEPGAGLLGFEGSAGPMHFVDDVSRITGDLPSGAVLFAPNRTACGINEVNEVRFSGIPGGRGGGDGNVVDSGRITCTQSAPGQDVDVTITDTVTDPARIPTKGLNGSPLSGGRKNYVVTGYLSLWVPDLPAGSSVTSQNTYRPLTTTSVSGAPNFPGGTEPTADNVARRSLVELAPGNGGKTITQVGADGAITAGSAKEGDPWVTPGQTIRSSVSASNPGLRSQNAVVCDTFDRATQRLTRVAGRYTAVTSSSPATVQYAAYDMADPAAGRSADCDDASGPWYDDPALVPGGPDAVGAVRATTTLTGGTSLSLYTYTRVLPVAGGTRVYDFGHLRFGTAAWRHDSADPVLGAGPLADSVLVTENRVRIAKKVVDDGYGADDTPDETSVVSGGDRVDFALYPSIANAGGDGSPTTLTVEDLLPAGTEYVPGSASPSPTVDSVDDDGVTRQRLTWDLEGVTPNGALAPITYTVSVSRLTPAGTLTNEVEVASPTDRSPEADRTAQRSVRLVSPGGIAVEKSAVHPVVVTGDDLEWTLGWTNQGSTDVHDVALVDVLPTDGDGLGSSFHGSRSLAAPVSVDAAAGEAVRYTAADPSSVSLDPADPSNRDGGATVWCTADAFGSAGCPADLAEASAFRIDRSAPVAPGATVVHQVALSTTGQQQDDRYTNRFGLRAADLALPVVSNRATVRIVAGSVGDTVWVDDDRDGLQDDDHPAAGVRAELSGTDDRGAQVTRSTDTDAAGHYRFDDLRPGDYRVRWSAPDGFGFTTAGVGADPGSDADAEPTTGRSDVVHLAVTTDESGATDGVSTDDDVDAGLVATAGGSTGTPGGSTGTPGGTPGPGSAAGPGADAGPGAAAGPATADEPRRPHGNADTDRTTGLAFTGAAGLLPLAMAAALALALGGTVLVRRRRPSRPGARDRRA